VTVQHFTAIEISRHYSITPASTDHRLKEQFVQQQRIDNMSMFDFETTLGNSRESSNLVRKLSPTQYRFRIVDAESRH